MLVVPALLALVYGLNAPDGSRTSNGRLVGLWMARAGWILGAASLLVSSGLMALVVTGVVGEGDKSAWDLEVGDCLRLDEDAEFALTVPTVDCQERHNWEVIFVGQLNPSATRDDPGDTDAEYESGEACFASWPDSIGMLFEESEFDAYWFSPSKSRWKRDRGRFVCMATSFERDLTSTVLASRR